MLVDVIFCKPVNQLNKLRGQQKLFVVNTMDTTEREQYKSKIKT